MGLNLEMDLTRLNLFLRHLAGLVRDYSPDNLPYAIDSKNIELCGFGHSKLSLAVYKETVPIEFALEQATFMMFLGKQITPKILSFNDTGYVMEYLRPAKMFVNSLREQERFLNLFIWERQLSEAPFTKQIGDESWRLELWETIRVKVPDWALDTPCLIHGDPTLDNTLEGSDTFIRITDPIPPHRLMRPSIRAIDHGKILQSFLGWEVVLRGTPRIEFQWPTFMCSYESARRAVFWCMVALKRIALRNNTSNAGKWAESMAGELEKCEW